MNLSSFIRKLFGGDKERLGAAIDYKGYNIRPAPRYEGGHYYVAGIISKSYPDGIKEQRFIRADTHAGREEADAHAVLKAQQIIDEQGDNLFTD